MWDDFVEMVLIPFAFIFGFVAVVIGLIMVSVDVLSARQCSNYAEVTQRQSVYRHFDACYVETKAGFMRWDEYKARGLAAEGMGAIAESMAD